MNKKRLKEVQLEILREIKRICNENGIQFFLDSGTLLGAVRHKGMIPWDDDIDIGMLRKDYEKFIKIACEKLSDNFSFQSWDCDKNFGLPYVKIRKKNTHFIERASADTGQNDGIFVDVFPYDNYPTSRMKCFYQKNMLYIISKVLLTKCGYAVWSTENGHKRKIKRFVYSLIELGTHNLSKSVLCAEYKKVATLCKDKGKFYFPQAGDGKYGRWKVPVECLEGFVELEFENQFYPCPQNYDLYLRYFYGDYMKLPPIEERKSMHNVFDIIIDE